MAVLANHQDCCGQEVLVVAVVVVQQQYCSNVLVAVVHCKILQAEVVDQLTEDSLTGQAVEVEEVEQDLIVQ
jgi:hypothetical protein